jgi:hypothetical protein
MTACNANRVINVRVSAFRIPQFHFVERNRRYVFGVIKDEGQFDIVKLPAINELDGAIDHFEIMCLAGVASPLVWALKIRPRRNLPQQRLHSLLIPFHMPQPSKIKSVADMMPGGIFLKIGRIGPHGLAKTRGFHAVCVKMTHFGLRP